ncbi:60S ribosomal export protein NMD3 [Sporosarcina sp. P17b]|nr:60S ribosomal export protein NMD3 [Sporosarcina sp. P17b]
MDITECVVCGKEIEALEQFNGEMMCEECYQNPENEVFGDE